MPNGKISKEQGKKILKTALIYTLFMCIGATQFFAYKVKYNEILGGYKLFNTSHKIYFPFAYIFWRKEYIEDVPKLIEQINWYLLVAILGYFLILLLIVKEKTKTTVHGSARWANNSEMKKMDLYKSTGTVLGCDPNGKIIRDNTDRHLAFFAPTRMGKGINSVTPTSYDWINSIVINDIKGELWGLTAGYRKEVLKQKVFMFCPVDTEGVSCSYNPLDFIAIGTGSEFEDVSIISRTLIDVEGKGDSDHWITSAINLLNGVILHVKYAKKDASLTDVVEFISPTTGSLSDSLADILGVAREDEEDEVGVALRTGCAYEEITENEKGEQVYPTKGYATFDHLANFEDKELFKKIYGYKGTERDIDCKLHPLVAKEFMSLYSTPDKERGSIISTATQKLKIFMDPIISKHIRHSDFTIKQLKEEKCSLYLVTPPRSIARTQPLLRLIFTQIVFQLTDRMKFDNISKNKKGNILEQVNNYLQSFKKSLKNFIYPEIKEEKNRILLLIDEFPSLGKLDVIEQSMSYIAGYGLKTFLISQSIGQFKKIYGKDNYILDNCSIQLYLTPNDPETPKMLSEKLGKYTVKTESFSKKGWELTPTKSISWIGRQLMTPEEVGTLPYEETLVFITGQNPIKGKKLFYYKDKRYEDKKLPTPLVSDKNIRTAIEETNAKEEYKKKIEKVKNWVVIADHNEFDYEEQLEEIKANYEVRKEITYEEMLDKRFELAYKYSLLNRENINNSKNKFFKTENIEEISRITKNYLERTNREVM